MTEPRQWRVNLPLTRPLSLNDRSHWRTRARETRYVRDSANVATRTAGVPTPLQRISIELHYIPRDKRRRDPLNLVATLKAVEDGIVDAGVIPDDTPEFSIPTMPIIDEPDRDPALAWSGRLYAIIREAHHGE